MNWDWNHAPNSFGILGCFRAGLGKLQAPLKGFYTFENAVHSPLFEESARVRQITEKDILRDANSLVDKN